MGSISEESHMVVTIEETAWTPSPKDRYFPARGRSRGLDEIAFKIVNDDGEMWHIVIQGCAIDIRYKVIAVETLPHSTPVIAQSGSILILIYREHLVFGNILTPGSFHDIELYGLSFFQSTCEGVIFIGVSNSHVVLINSFGEMIVNRFYADRVDSVAISRDILTILGSTHLEGEVRFEFIIDCSLQRIQAKAA